MTRRFGWVDDRAARREVSPRVLQARPNLATPGTGAGKVVLLHQVWERATGRAFPVWSQGIGDCVGWGWALGLSVLQGVAVARLGGSYLADVASEPIYAGSRVEIGGRKLGPQEDGSVGAWAAAFAVKYGAGLLRRQYPAADLGVYVPQRARRWGWDGVPDSLEPEAGACKVGTVSAVTGYAEARDWMASTAGPVVVCSSVGFDGQRDRDADGFLRARGTWPHCMCFVAVDDTATRPGLLCCNSWGPGWVGGPKRLGQPDGSFWVDARTVDRMLSEGDSYGVADFTGVAPLDWVMY